MVDFAIPAARDILTSVRHAADRGGRKGALAEEGTCPACTGDIVSELPGGSGPSVTTCSSRSSVRYQTRQKKEGKNELEDGDERRVAHGRVASF